MSVVVCHVTCSSHEEALTIARALVSERLIASANILPGLVSIYRWQGKVHEEGEVLLLLKTRAELAEAVTAAVRRLHGYTCPCVAILPVVGGNPAYLDWIAAETAI